MFTSTANFSQDVCSIQNLRSTNFKINEKEKLLLEHETYQTEYLKNKSAIEIPLLKSVANLLQDVCSNQICEVQILCTKINENRNSFTKTQKKPNRIPFKNK